ncbi:MAG: response regulator transcription factor [Opitutaceae bacterium]
MNLQRITVVLADDHGVVREGLRSWLQSLGDFEVVGEATNGREAVALARKLRPTVVVIDISMPLLSGGEATRQIRHVAPGTRVLALSAHGDDEYVAQLVEAGVSGYVVKHNSMEVLTHAIREVAGGRTYFSASLSPRLKAAVRLAREAGTPIATPASLLSSREAEVLQLVAEGLGNKQIAAELCITTKTVEKHRQQLMDKLGIHNTAGLTRHAIATGVIASGNGANVAAAE